MPRDRPRLTPLEKAAAQQVFAEGKACPDCIIPGMHIGSYLPAPIEDFARGSQVFGIDGRPHAVVNAVAHDYNGPALTVTARGSLPLTITSEHQFLVFPALHHTPNRSGWRWRQKYAAADEQPVWRRADELAVGDYLVSPIPRLDGPEPPKRWGASEACWLIGLLAGDGHVSRRRISGGKYACYHIGCTLSDVHHVERAVEAFRDLSLKVHVRESATYWDLTVSSRECAEDVYAFIGSGAENKHLPAFVWSSKDRLSAALSGVMAADGTILHPKRTPHRTTRRLFTVSQVLGWQIWTAALALGEKPYMRAVNRRPGSGYANAKPAWTVEWPDSDARCFTARTDEFYVMPITKIEPSTYTGLVHDLTIQDVHTFTANGLLTHNCGGVHQRACPRIRRQAWIGQGSAAGARTEVEYWRDGQWDDSGVIWPEEAYEPDAEAPGG